MKTLLYLTILICAIACSSKTENTSNPEEAIFPDSWTGQYKGDLVLIKNGVPGDTSTMEFKMYRLDMDRTAFHIKYEAENAWRAYEIYPGKAVNHWIMDEQNSILIDQYYEDNTLKSTFIVEDKNNPENKSMIHATYRKDGKNIISTMTTYPMNYGKVTGDSLDWKITSYREQMVQKCVLRPVKN